MYGLHLVFARLLPNHAPTDRSKRVKDAKNEAQKEIEEYRKHKDDEFKEFEKKVCTPIPPIPSQAVADVLHLTAAHKRQQKS